MLSSLIFIIMVIIKIDLLRRILAVLQSGRSVFLVGSTDSGKTRFVQNELVPFLNKQEIRVNYFASCDNLPKEGIKNTDFVIVDEVEVMQDMRFLETLHPNERPYYSAQYTNKVQQWFRALNRIQQTGVFVVTRKKRAIPNFIKNVQTLDWNGKTAEAIEFTDDHSHTRA